MTDHRSSGKACLIMLAFAGGLFALPAAAQETIRIGGTGSAIGAMQHLGKAFEARQREVAVVVAPSIGSTGAVKAVQSGALHIGLSSRPPADGAPTAGIVYEEYASTPIVPVVNSRTPVTAVTSAEVERIYRGEMTAWPNGDRIRIVLRPRSDIDTTLVGSISPGIGAALAAASQREGILVGLTDQENADLIERTPGGFGFSALSVVVSEHRAIKVLSLDGAAPTLAALARKTYPHAKKLYLVLPEKPSPGAVRFIAFLRSPEGRAILESTGSLPVMPKKQP